MILHIPPSDYFDNSKLNDLIVVKEEDSIDEIYEKINLCIKNKDEILSLYKDWKKEHSEKVKKCRDEFLEFQQLGE